MLHACAPRLHWSPCTDFYPALPQARSLTVVLREPCGVEVPLSIAAKFPANAQGRWALTTGNIVDRSQGATPLPWSADSEETSGSLRTWLNELFPHSNARFGDIAEVDGAAAMWAAVQGSELHWVHMHVYMQSVASLGYTFWDD